MRIHALLLAAAFMFFIADPVSAQEWEKTYPAWETDGIEDILHWGGDTLFAGGYNTTLLRSIDAGESWARVDLSGITLSDSLLYLNIKKLARLGNDLYFVAAPGSPPDRPSDNPWIHEDSILFVYRYTVSAGYLADISLQRKVRNMSPSVSYNLTVSDTYIWVAETSSLDDSSTVYRSSNRGDDWMELASRAELYAMSALTDSILIAVESRANKAYVLRSTDAGASWNAHDDTVFVANSRLYSVAREPRTGRPHRVVLSATTSMVLTSDLGATWADTEALRVGTKFFDVVSIAVDNTGALLAVGKTTDIYKSQSWNGGWIYLKERQDQHNNQYRYASDIVCTPSTVIVSTKEGIMYRSEDLSDWAPVDVGEIREIRKLHFFDTWNGLMLAETMDGQGYVFRTDDGGSNWTMHSDAGTIWLDVLWETATKDSLRSAHIQEKGIGTAIYFRRSTDKGLTWELNTSSYVPGRITRLHVEGGLYFAWNTGLDSLWCSPDFGATWLKATIPPNVRFEYDYSNIEVRPSRSGAQVVYTADMWHRSQSIYRSTNYCRDWELVTEFQEGENVRVNNLIAVSEDSLVVVLSGVFDSTYQTSVLMSPDAGATWTQLHSGPVWYGIGTLVVNYPNIYRLKSGGNFTLYKSEDGFRNFDVQLHKEASYSPVSFFLNADIGWIAAGQTIWHTTTGGIVWVEQPFTVSESAAITHIYPNPVGAGQSVAIGVHLPIVGAQRAVPTGDRRSPLRVSVSDLLGREVAELYNGDADPGTRTLTWQPSATLPAGMYMVRMTLGDKVWAKQVAVVR